MRAGVSVLILRRKTSANEFAPTDRAPSGTHPGQSAGGNAGTDEDGEHTVGGARRNRNRYRDRRNRSRNRDGMPMDQGDPVINEDDVLVPVAGIVHLLENYAFVRTSGYLAGPNDVYLHPRLVAVGVVGLLEGKRRLR